MYFIFSYHQHFFAQKFSIPFGEVDGVMAILPYLALGLLGTVKHSK